jgi:hypothetical protein
MRKAMTSNTFASSGPKPTSSLVVNFWPEIPQLEMWTEDDRGSRTKYGPSVILKDGAIEHFVSWLNAQRQGIK